MICPWWLSWSLHFSWFLNSFRLSNCLFSVLLHINRILVTIRHRSCLNRIQDVLHVRRFFTCAKKNQWKLIFYINIFSYICFCSVIARSILLAPHICHTRPKHGIGIMHMFIYTYVDMHLTSLKYGHAKGTTQTTFKRRALAMHSARKSKYSALKSPLSIFADRWYGFYLEWAQVSFTNFFVLLWLP